LEVIKSSFLKGRGVREIPFWVFDLGTPKKIILQISEIRFLEEIGFLTFLTGGFIF